MRKLSKKIILLIPMLIFSCKDEVKQVVNISIDKDLVNQINASSEPTPSTTPTAVSSEKPKLETAGYALLFDGKSSYINVSSSEVLNLSSALTIQAWIRPDFSEGSQELTFPIVSKGFKDLRYVFSIKNNNSSQLTLSNKPLTLKDEKYISNTWYNLSISWNGTNVKLYRNGLLISSDDLKLETLTGSESDKLVIGANLANNTFFKGEIDEVRIWNVALSQEEIRKNMHTVMQGNELGLVSYWKFDDGSGDKISDSGSEKTSGTLVNFGTNNWKFSTAPIF